MSAALPPAGQRHRGRFAPSPTGPLHAGSLVAALGSWLDARAHGGDWLVRIEDVDGPRCVPGADEAILRQLAALGLHPDEPPQWQSRHGERYQRALARLQAQGDVYPCGCSRRDIALALAAQGRPHARHAEWVYPGTCRGGVHGAPSRVAWRLRCGDARHPVVIDWQDRRLGPQRQDVTAEVGDVVLRRADGLWAYQLAVVVDDAAQGITDVVRGEDLADNTARQVHVQRCLGLPSPRYLHLPLVRDARGEKLSKQHGAPALDTSRPLAVLNQALGVLGLAPLDGPTLAEWQARAVTAWRSGWQDARFWRPEQERT
jgi:glutamyl-Q tRNA(Asp) synthetase